MSDITASIATAIQAKTGGNVEGKLPEWWAEFIGMVLAELQSTGRLLADDEMRLTAEQMEDVRLLAASVVKTNRGAAFEARDRLRALFPAAEPAEVTGQDFLEAMPTEPDCWDVREHPSAPAEPAEEETKAEYPHRGLGDLTVLGPEIFTNGEVINWRGENFMRQQDPASSPVVPAPTETGPQTLEGPWDRIEDIPKTVVRVTDRDGDVWEWDGDNWVTPETAILPTTYINRKYAPFVAAEEG